MEAKILDPTPCQLGEGPIWHPQRGQLFWCDILGRKLFTHAAGTTNSWSFDTLVSALGWIDEERLLLASETELALFHLDTGESETLVPLEADRPANRSNDGRADPFGGFWIGTMGKAFEKGAGAIYRYYRGELRTLYPGITVPNAICFSPDGQFAYFTDSAVGIIMRQRLDPADGWPRGDPEEFLDLRGQGWVPDGAVVDAAGNIWNAQWGGWRVACYSSSGEFQRAVEFDAANTSCPAFGGEGLNTLFCTSALFGVSDDDLDKSPNHGKTFAAEAAGTGLPENRVVP